jgi:hypothetical protein
MRHLLTQIVPHEELKATFDSAEIQEYLDENAHKTTGEVPFLYRWISNDDPDENLAAAYIFPGADTVWVELLVINDVQQIPKYPL